MDLSRRLVVASVVCVTGLLFVSCVTTHGRSSDDERSYDEQVRAELSVISPFSVTPDGYKRVAVYEHGSPGASERFDIERPLKEALEDQGYYAISLVAALPVLVRTDDPRLLDILKHHRIDILILTATSFDHLQSLSSDVVVIEVHLDTPDPYISKTETSLFASTRVIAERDVLYDMASSEDYIDYMFERQARIIAEEYSSLFATRIVPSNHGDIND